MKLTRSHLASLLTLLTAVIIGLAVFFSQVSVPTIINTAHDNDISPRGCGGDIGPTSRDMETGPRTGFAGEADCSVMFEVAFRDVQPVSPVPLFVRSIKYNVTFTVPLSLDSAQGLLIGTQSLAVGEYLLALDDDLAMDVSALYIRPDGYTTGSSTTIVPFTIPVRINVSAGYSLRVETVDELGAPVSGTLRVFSLSTDFALNRRTHTNGDCMMYQMPRTPATIHFQPYDSSYDPASGSVTPTNTKVVIRIPVRRGIQTKVRFVDLMRQDSAEVCLLRVVFLDESAVNERAEQSFRLTDGALLPTDAVPGSGVYEFSWIKGGNSGPTVSRTRAQLAEERELVLFPPSHSGEYVRVVVVDEGGHPVASLQLDLVYQGLGWQRMSLTTDNSGAIVVPEWDRNRFTLVVRPPKHIHSTPLLLMNPENGARFIVRPELEVARALVEVEGDSTVFKRSSVRLRLWAHPDSSLDDWQLAVRLNESMQSTTIDGNEVAIGDALAIARFDNPNNIWVCLELGRAQLGSWPLSEYLKHDRNDQIVLRISSATILQPVDLRVLDRTGEWIITHGRRAVAEMICISLRRRDDPDLVAGVFGAVVHVDNPFSLRCPTVSSEFTGISEDGTVAIFSAKWVGGRVDLHVAHEFLGTTVELATASGKPSMVVLTSSFYQHSDGTSDRVMYWDEFATPLKVTEPSLKVKLPCGVPLLIMPITESYAPTIHPVTLSDFIHRASVGRDLSVVVP